MRRNKARFVTVCQQSLALGAVLAVLAPAANVISLDVVGTIPGTPSAERSPGSRPVQPPDAAEGRGRHARRTGVGPRGGPGRDRSGRARGRGGAAGARRRPAGRPGPPRDRQRAREGHRLRRGRRHLGPRPGAEGRPDQGPGPHPHRRHVDRRGPRSSTTRSTAPTPTARRAGRRVPAPTRCWSATSTRCRPRP